MRITVKKSVFTFLVICIIISSAFSYPYAFGSAKTAPAVEGKAYTLYDAQSGTFLCGKNQDTPLPPASITKVMTILLAFENLDLTDEITVTHDMIKGIPGDYMLLGLVEGEVITVEQALYACLLISANDAALTLAVKMGGSEKGFADMMNARAIKLGCLNTHFTNSYGYSDKKHLISARDMALIMAEALKNEIYTKISTTKEYTMPATNKFPTPRRLVNTNRFISTDKYNFKDYIGGKTGFTNLSNFTITAGARKNDRTLVAVILGAAVSETRYSDLISLFNYGFTEYSTENINFSDFAEVQIQTTAKISTAIEKSGGNLIISNTDMKLQDYITTTSVKISGGYSYVTNMEVDIDRIVAKAKISDQIMEFPLFRKYADGSADKVGSLEITVSPKEADAAANKPKLSVFTIILRIIISIFLAIVLLTIVMFIYLYIRKYIRRHRKRKRKRVA